MSEQRASHGKSVTSIWNLRRIVRAFGYSLNGLRYAWRNEGAFRQELAAGVVLVPLAIWLGSTWVERTLLLAAYLFVLIVELLNSALEAVVDRHGPERHPLAGAAKDLGSAAVLIALVILGVTWLPFLWMRFFP